MIYTASFFEPENFGQERLVSIAIEMPEDFMNQHPDREIVTNDILQPTWNMVNARRAEIKTPEEYERQYWRLLRERLLTSNWCYAFQGKLEPEEVLCILNLQDNDTLLCWERHPKFCHRILVARLLTSNGVQVVRR